MAALLLLAGAPAGGFGAVRSALAARVESVPRLRQRLHRAPLGCGRPIWVDDPQFDIAHHVRVRSCPAPGDERALLDLAAVSVAQRLPPQRPLWAATFVTDLHGGSTGLVLVMHHVLADGIGGLEVLRQLVDTARSAGTATPFPRPAPSRSALARDALSSRLSALARLPSWIGRLREAAVELRPSDPHLASRCSLNRPVGARRRLTVVRCRLSAVRSAAHAHGGTVNDVLLTAVTAALDTLLRRRGEHVETIIVSVPVSARSSVSPTSLGNDVGAFPVALPTAGTPPQRLERTARQTRSRGRRGASAAVFEPLFRGLAVMHLARWLIRRQHLVHTFVTNLRGPAEALTFLRTPVTEIVPVSAASGNATVVFAALSYAGSLLVTIVADPDRCPDQDQLTAELQRELERLTGPVP